MEEVLEEVGLYLISHYAEVRQQTIANFIVDRLIVGYCEGGGGNVDPSLVNFGGSNQLTWMRQELSHREPWPM